MSNDPARGDTRPCVVPGCEGMMHYGREPMPPSRGRESNGGQPGWLCSLRADHFTTTHALAMTAAAGVASARAGWDDDGGRSA